MDKKIFIKYWLPVIAYAAVIFISSSLPNPPAANIFPACDKFYHFLEYALFCFLLLRALFYSKKNSGQINLRLLALLLTVVYILSDEFHQHFVPGRSMDMIDALSGSIGAYIGQLFFKIKG